MLHSAAVRLILAAYLAIASPALCCCGLRAFANRALGVEAPACHAERCCTQVNRHAIQPPAAGSCCSANANDSAPRGQDSRGERPCRCHERDTLVIRADGPTTALAAGASHPMDGLVAQPMELPPFVLGEALAFSIRPIALDLPPPTLLRQRCLLLV
jgi:hypothetical protein